MGKWFFTASNGSVVAKMTPDTDEVREKTITFRNFSLTNAIDKLRFFESGEFKFSALFTRIGDIGGVTPTDINDAETLLLALIPTASGGGGGTYDNVTVYDTPGALPITIAANTIHSISVLSITGDTVITIGGESTTLVAGQSTSITATALIDDVIVLNSASGTFLATTLS